MFNKIYSFVTKIFNDVLNYVYQILEKYQYKELSEKEINLLCDVKLNKWIVDQYANNSYLHNIPQERKQLKRDAFRKELIKKYNVKHK